MPTEIHGSPQHHQGRVNRVEECDDPDRQPASGFTDHLMGQRVTIFCRQVNCQRRDLLVLCQ